MVLFDEEKQRETLQELRSHDAEQFAAAVAEKQGLPYVDLTGMPINTDALRLIKEDAAREAEVAAFDLIGKRVRVGFRSPSKSQGQEIINALEQEGYSIEPYMISQKSLEKAWSRYKDISYATQTKAGLLDISLDEIATLSKELKNTHEVAREIEKTLSMKGSHRITRLSEVIMAGALALGASDIHIEPQQNGVAVRMRLDGILVPVLSIDFDTYKLLLSRIKLLSGLKLNVSESAQDGRFTLDIQGREIEMRTSVLPGTYGESILLRILDPDTLDIPMNELGMLPHIQALVENELKKPNGMILNTGPTGSGKTTALYAFLRSVQKPGLKVITIEDPVEYRLEGVVQTQVNPEKNYTFHEGLRSALRQDPDIIMIGEIRDSETAATAIHAALTGHLVFSTLHTNNAAGTFPRLVDLSVNPDVIGSAINIAMAQRLVRKLCNNCKKEVPVNHRLQELIDRILKKAPHEEEWGELLPAKKVWEPVGCNKCNSTGYDGRIAIFEAILIDKAVDTLIKERASEPEIAKAAESQNVMSMAQDGLTKVLRGITALAELERVVDLTK